MLASLSWQRKPVLRRSLRDAWLYCTDLPMCAEEDAVAEFRRRADARGWCTERDGNWIQLTREIAAPPGGFFDGPFGEEAACCASLLRRQGRAGPRDAQPDARADGQLILIRLCKAGEEGPEAYERVCAAIHREWAERLRNRQGLPDADLGFFGATEPPSDGIC